MFKKSAGIIHLIPLLIVAFAAISILALSLEPKPQKSISTAVLSESEGGGGHGGDSGGSSGSGSSGSDSSGTGSGGSSNASSGDSKAGSGGTSTSSRPVTLPRLREIEASHNETEKEQEHTELEIENENEFEVAEGTESARVKIGKREDKFTFFEQKFGAESEFPVSVNKTTHELTITTPQGIKVVAILPDAAVENILGQNVIDRVLGINGRLVEVKVDKNGNIVYEISGIKDEKFFGIFNVAIPKILNVSTQTGDVTNISQDLLSKLLDTLSF